MRFEKKKYILAKVNQILIGYYHYYGISDNYQMMDNFCLLYTSDAVDEL